MRHKVDHAPYFAYAKDLSEAERDFVREFTEWLPPAIIDCHAHCNQTDHCHWVDDRAYRHMLSTFPSFDLEESKAWHALLHPGKNIRTLRFSNVFRGIDHRAANFYLLTQSAKQDRVALYGLSDDPDYTIRMLAYPRVSALKMYYLYPEPTATEIYQYFPRAILAVAQEKNLPIVLHPPQRITLCLDQILELIHDFPRLRICLAHLSLTKEIVPGLEEAFKAIAKYPQVYFDTALVPSAELVAMAVNLVGADRIMYGSDEPLHLIRSVPYTHPQRGERIVTGFPYHWADPEEHAAFKFLAQGATHAHWQALRAIKAAISSLAQEKQAAAKQKIFHDNAKLFYGF